MSAQSYRGRKMCVVHMIKFLCNPPNKEAEIKFSGELNRIFYEMVLNKLKNIGNIGNGK